MSYSTTYDKPLLLSANDKLVFGTAMLNANFNFGIVHSASVKRTADQQELLNSIGGLLAILRNKHRFEAQFDAVFPIDKTAPGDLSLITFPIAGVQGRVLDTDIKWEHNGFRMLSIQATSWDELASANTYQLAPTGDLWLPVTP